VTSLQNFRGYRGLISDFGGVRFPWKRVWRLIWGLAWLLVAPFGCSQGPSPSPSPTTSYSTRASTPPNSTSPTWTITSHSILWPLLVVLVIVSGFFCRRCLVVRGCLVRGLLPWWGGGGRSGRCCGGHQFCHYQALTQAS